MASFTWKSEPMRYNSTATAMITPSERTYAIDQVFDCRRIKSLIELATRSTRKSSRPQNQSFQCEMEYQCSAGQPSSSKSTAKKAHESGGKGSNFCNLASSLRIECSRLGISQQCAL